MRSCVRGSQDLRREVWGGMVVVVVGGGRMVVVVVAVGFREINTSGSELY